MLFCLFSNVYNVWIIAPSYRAVCYMLVSVCLNNISQYIQILYFKSRFSPANAHSIPTLLNLISVNNTSFLNTFCVFTKYLVGDDIRTIERNADVLLIACKDIGLAVNIGKTKYIYQLK